jgi:GT2 family glycosyltransferase
VVKKIAVVTINYRIPDETVACIRSFDKLKTVNLSLSFFVIDNGGTADTGRELARRLPGVDVIVSNKNLGFAGGCNLAIKEALNKKFDYVLLINPDTLIESVSFLEEMIATEADIVSPLIKYISKGKDTYDFGGKVDHVFGRNTHITGNTKSIPSEKPDYFTGACLLIKTKVFKKIGLLDDGYFLYYEDADFCLRAAKAGFSQKLCSKAILFHYLSTTTSKIGKKKVEILANSHLRFCRTPLPILNIPLYRMFNSYMRSKLLFS